MVTVLDKSQRIQESHKKILAPLKLDESMCFYSPQDNVDALRHPRVRNWIRFVLERYKPKLPRGRRRILLLLPCTKTKPYPLSREHLHINQALLEAGSGPRRRIWRSTNWLTQPGRRSLQR